MKRIFALLAWPVDTFTKRLCFIVGMINGMIASFENSPTVTALDEFLFQNILFIVLFFIRRAGKGAIGRVTGGTDAQRENDYVSNYIFSYIVVILVQFQISPLVVVVIVVVVVIFISTHGTKTMDKFPICGYRDFGNIYFIAIVCIIFFLDRDVLNRG